MPAIVASNVPSVTWLVAVWVAGGLVALMGALCFAELTTTYPDRGGDYGYLKRGYHYRVGFAFSLGCLLGDPPNEHCLDGNDIW